MYHNILLNFAGFFTLCPSALSSITDCFPWFRGLSGFQLARELTADTSPRAPSHRRVQSGHPCLDKASTPISKGDADQALEMLCSSVLCWLLYLTHLFVNCPLFQLSSLTLLHAGFPTDVKYPNIQCSFFLPLGDGYINIPLISN